MKAKKEPAKRGTAKKATARKPAAAKKPAAARKPAAAKAAAARKPAAAKRAPAKRATTKRTSTNRNSTRTNAKQPTSLARMGASQIDDDPLGIDSSIVRAEAARLDARRPPDNVLPNGPSLNYILHDLIEIRDYFETYAQHLRPLDRKRLNGVGMKKMGFIDKAYDMAITNSEFLPHYLTLAKFSTDKNRFETAVVLNGLVSQVKELLWNITIVSSDILYTDALEFYQSIKDAAKRRVDAAEAVFNELRDFFSSRGHGSQPDGEEEPTIKEEERDASALMHGKREGEIIIRNVKPKITAGKREVIDKKFTDSEQFKDTTEGEIKE